MIIVDEGIPAESLEGLRKSGIDVVLVKECNPLPRGGQGDVITSPVPG
jgi:hypothetical protein